MLKDDDVNDNLEAALDMVATHIKKEYALRTCQRKSPERLLLKCTKVMQKYSFPLHYRLALTLVLHLTYIDLK